MPAPLLVGAVLLGLAGVAHAQAPARPPPSAPSAAEKPPEKPSGMRLETTVTLRGPGGRWGAPVADDLNRRLYLPRGPAGLTVLSLDGFKPLAEVAETAGSIAVALDPETLRGFSANLPETKPDEPAAGGISVFDQRGFKPVGKVAVAGVRHILYDAATRQVVAATEDGALALIDPAKLTVTATLALAGKRIAALATDRRGRVFAALADRDAIVVVNLVTREVATTWQPEGCRQPMALAFDSVGMRLIAACRGARAQAASVAVAETAMVVDPLSGQALGRLAMPSGAELVVHDPVQRLLYLASGVSAGLMVYRQQDPYRYDLLESVGTRPLAGMAAADGRTGRLILATAEFVATPPRQDGTGGGVRVLANTYALLVMKRLPLE